MNKKIHASKEPLSKEDKQIIIEIANKPRKYGKIEFLMSLSGFGEVPQSYEELEMIEFQLTSNSAENLTKLESSFDKDIIEALGNKVKIHQE